ncbi:PREDICTED: glutamate receptor 1.2-like isoform X2 [Ipomoea nil]|uniref:glutamate receptor 1.2-like isoform X2 n=1 Tax=Ipomoea nil TaxID=35883 RepID=UPI0009013592|nr:PREDICTED: glutamate receptor 1.2-like isoform X2 [Ipomoea nil]
MRKCNMIYSLIIFLLFGEFTSSRAAFRPPPGGNFNVGVVVDEGSAMGKVVRSCVTMAVFDYNERPNGTRIHLHVRNSEGDPLLALTAVIQVCIEEVYRLQYAAQHLLENNKVEAIFIMPETSSEATLLAILGDKAKVPVFSFSPLPSSTQHPYLIQVSEDESTGLKGVTAFVAAHKWKNVIIIHDQPAGDAMKALSYLLNTLQEDNNVRVVHVSTLSPLTEDNRIIEEELNKLKKMQTSIFIVHVSAPLAARLFQSAKTLGMMAAGYAWMVTDKTMDLFHTLDPEAIESMQGAVGFKSYVPNSPKLQDFTLRWKKEAAYAMELNVFGIRAYDAVWALGKAIRGSANISDSLVLHSKFAGLSGQFELLDGKLVSNTYAVVNVIGPGEKRVGFWTNLSGFPEKNIGSIIWPGPSLATPKDTQIRRLRIGVPVKKGFNEFIAVSEDNQTGKTTATGFCVDVFDAAIRILGYEVPYDFIRFVVLDDNEPSQGNYNDLIYQIHVQKFDAVVGDTTFTSNRSSYVDFTLPYTDPGVGTVARLGNTGKWFFLKPFTRDLWIVTVISFIITGFTIWLIEHERNEEFQGSPAQQLGTILWFTSSTLVYAQRERLLSHLSRFVLCIWMLVVFIISSSYTATLSSLLTLEQIQLAKGDYIGYRFFSQGIIFNNTNFADTKLIRYISREDYHEALSNGSIGGIIDEIPYIKSFLAKYPSQYALIKTTSTTNGFSFAFQKGSPLVAEFSGAIAQLREEGKLKELEDKWFNKEEALLPQETDGPNVKTLDVDSFRYLFLVSGISKAIAVMVFLWYMLCKKLWIYNCIIRIASRGNLPLMLRYLFPIKPNTINGVHATSPV